MDPSEVDVFLQIYNTTNSYNKSSFGWFGHLVNMTIGVK